MNSGKNAVSWLAMVIAPRGRATLRRSHSGGAVLGMAGNAPAQVNRGSDGHDGAFSPTTGTVINLADHPDGIAYCTSATTFSPMSASAGRPFRTRDLLCCPLVPTFPP